jgi:2,3-bisphosphoglycerate-independent phosphoglycerate mutase
MPVPPPIPPFPNAVLLVFLDGVGLGPAGVENPLASQELPAFRRLAGGTAWTREGPVVRTPTHVFRPLDAGLGVAGLPQSGTGQATLFTGVNCAALAGRHFGPYPHSTSKPVLEQESVFARLRAASASPEPAAFANAYPERFFAYAEARTRWTVTTFACRAAGVRLRTDADLRAGRALAADLTNVRWRAELDPTMPAISEADAAGRLARLAAAHPFTLFEYYLTDKAGHAQDPEGAAAVLRTLDRFFDALLDRLDPGALLVVTSDHGNLEDLSVKTHTRNPVPLVAVGPGADAFAEAEDLTAITPALLRSLGL